jgi:hypothetical protein
MVVLMVELSVEQLVDWKESLRAGWKAEKTVDRRVEQMGELIKERKKYDVTRVLTKREEKERSCKKGGKRKKRKKGNGKQKGKKRNKVCRFTGWLHSWLISRLLTWSGSWLVRWLSGRL